MNNDIKETKIWISQRDKKYRYMLLDRMRSDCEYYLNGHKCVNHLWGKTEEEQIICCSFGICSQRMKSRNG